MHSRGQDVIDSEDELALRIMQNFLCNQTEPMTPMKLLLRQSKDEVEVCCMKYVRAIDSDHDFQLL